MLYEGNFFNGNCCGEGILVWSDGTKFEGYFGHGKCGSGGGGGGSSGGGGGSSGGSSSGGSSSGGSSQGMFQVTIQMGPGTYIRKSGRSVFGTFLNCIIREAGSPCTRVLIKNKPTLRPRRPDKCLSGGMIKSSSPARRQRKQEPQSEGKEVQDVEDFTSLGDGESVDDY